MNTSTRPGMEVQGQAQRYGLMGIAAGQTRGDVSRWGALAFILLLIWIGPFVIPHDPLHIDLESPLQAPSYRHWLGTDQLGRDGLSRLLWGGQFSLTMAFLASVAATTIGSILGILAGHRGSWLDLTISSITDFSLSFPVLFLLLMVHEVFAEQPWYMVVFMAMFYWMPVARVVRAEVQAIMSLPFIRASVALGATPWQQWSWHILPRLWKTVQAMFALTMAGVLLTEATLSYLGLGVQPPYPSWGRMISEAQPYLYDAPWLLLAPALAITTSVWLLYSVSDTMQKLQR